MTAALAKPKPLPLEQYKPLALRESAAVQEVETAMDAHAALAGPRKHITKAQRRRMLDLREQSAVITLLNTLPATDETFYCVCDGSFSLWNVVPAIARIAAPAVIDDLTIATLSFSAPNIQEMCSMLDAGQVRKLTLLVSGYFKATSPEIFKDAHTGLIGRGQVFAARRNHMKVVGIRFSDNRTVTIHGSANLRSGRNAENFAVEGNPTVYEFFKSAIDDLINTEEVRHR